jgi:DNA-binding NarL/FixJ family response regulator
MAHEIRMTMNAIMSYETVIILMAYRWDEALEEAVKAGVDSLISKSLFTTLSKLIINRQNSER